MRKSIFRYLIVLALGSMAMIAFARHDFGPAGRSEPDPERLVARMVERLDLSADQELQIGNLVQSEHHSTAPDRERLKALHKQLRAQSDNYDAGQVQHMANEVGEITSRLTYSKASTHAQVNLLLTEEQRELARAMHEDRRPRRSHKRDECPSCP
ncbi:MAG: hypothetical protein HOC23_16140 [Halieaceae bacterium]|jgi:periplasmic protein CpxP/Spy|nr:hypothetical protein [Halieaceae bacterium]